MKQPVFVLGAGMAGISCALELQRRGYAVTLPDSLPITGPALRHENLWLAFAHSHMGFTMGPITGQLIANFISASKQPFSPAACSPARYL